MSSDSLPSLKEHPESDDVTQASTIRKGASPSKSSYLLVSTLCIFAAMGGLIFGGYDTGTILAYVNMPVSSRN
ncbi:Hexose transporter 2 [Sugiyamaella lignohabitans]|uniref:Hexose transporter 2 n=1 Tax=Sugiyamaella lignohabitans TaxID=796027 RepID=A0A167FUR1_9ASCO|nr:Hexose transporter 2 [Sugiyamaella lignohabitans]ANB15726.1 Hexose transporter 2 [Sugiyamaella lignohabitans]